MPPIIYRREHSYGKAIKLVQVPNGDTAVFVACNQKTASDNARLLKVSCNDLSQDIADIEVVADTIYSMKVLTVSTTDYVVLGYTGNASYLGTKYLASAPISTYINYSRPVGMIEEPVALAVDATYTYFLTPGVASGENAKIYVMNTGTGAYVETIDLASSGNYVTNAIDITKDATTNLWVTTVDSLVRVWYDVQWNLVITPLTYIA